MIAILKNYFTSNNFLWIKTPAASLKARNLKTCNRLFPGGKSGLQVFAGKNFTCLILQILPGKPCFRNRLPGSILRVTGGQHPEPAGWFR